VRRRWGPERGQSKQTGAGEQQEEGRKGGGGWWERRIGVQGRNAKYSRRGRFEDRLLPAVTKIHKAQIHSK